MICKYFLSFLERNFLSCLFTVDCVLWPTNILSFDVMQFIYFFFCYLCFWCQIQEIIPKSNIMKLSPFIFLYFMVLALIFRYLIHFEIIFKNWSIFDLQCCVNFCWTAKWFIYTYVIFTFFFIFFSIMAYHRILNIVPCAVQ